MDRKIHEPVGWNLPYKNLGPDWVFAFSGQIVKYWSQIICPSSIDGAKNTVFTYQSVISDLYKNLENGPISVNRLVSQAPPYQNTRFLVVRSPFRGHFRSRDLRIRLKIEWLRTTEKTSNEKTEEYRSWKFQKSALIEIVDEHPIFGSLGQDLKTRKSPNISFIIISLYLLNMFGTLQIQFKWFENPSYRENTCILGRNQGTIAKDRLFSTVLSADPRSWGSWALQCARRKINPYHGKGSKNGLTLTPRECSSLAIDKLDQDKLKCHFWHRTKNIRLDIKTQF